MQVIIGILTLVKDQGAAHFGNISNSSPRLWPKIAIRVPAVSVPRELSCVHALVVRFSPSHRITSPKFACPARWVFDLGENILRTLL